MNRKHIGIFIIVVALILIGYFVKITFFNNNNQNESKVISNEVIEEDDQKHKDVITEDTKQSHKTISDIDTDINYEIPKEIQEKIDVIKFDKAFKKYLKNNQLYTSNTKATSDDILTEDFNKHYITFNLRLNNYNKNTIIVVENQDGSFDFDFY